MHCFKITFDSASQISETTMNVINCGSNKTKKCMQQGNVLTSVVKLLNFCKFYILCHLHIKISFAVEGVLYLFQCRRLHMTQISHIYTLKLYISFIYDP